MILLPDSRSLARRWRVRGGALTAGLAALCAGWAGPALASTTTGAAAAMPGPLEVVTVTATRRPLTARETPVALSVIEGADFSAAGVAVVPEALRASPGAFFQQTTPGQGTPILRGLRGSQVLHLVDGMRLNNAIFRDAPNQYFALVDPFTVERIEVLRGAAGGLYGSDAMGGVVAVQSRLPRPGEDDLRPDFRLFGSWDSADHGLAGRGETSWSGRRAALLAGYSWQDRRDRRTGGGETVRPTAWRSRAADLALAFEASGGAWLLQAEGLEQPATPRIDELVPGFGQDEPAAAEYLFEPNRRTFLHARYRRETNHRWWRQVAIDVARQVITDDRRIREFASPVVTTEQNESTLDGLTLQVSAEPAPDWSLVWGAELYRDDVRSARQLRPAGDVPPVPVRGRFPDGARMDGDALYVDIAWLGSGRWGVESGLRYSRFDIALPGDGATPDTRLTPDDLTGDFRVRFDAAPRVQLLANLGRGFRAPNVFDLGAVGPRPGNRFNVANPALQPESVWSADLGMRAWSDAWSFEVFAFALDYRDKIVSVPTGDVTEEGRIVVRSENRAKARVFGVESSVEWRLSDRLGLAAVLNATRGEETDAEGLETPGDRIPPLNGRIGITWRPAEPWSVESYFLFAARQDRLSPRDRVDPRIDPDGTAGWVTVNLAIGWQARPGLRLGLRLENLADEAYREHGSGIDAPGRNLGFWAEARF